MTHEDLNQVPYTPPTPRERDHLEWAMRHHEATRNTAPNGRSRQERSARWIAHCLKQLQEDSE